MFLITLLSHSYLRIFQRTSRDRLCFSVRLWQSTIRYGPLRAMPVFKHIHLLSFHQPPITPRCSRRVQSFLHGTYLLINFSLHVSSAGRKTKEIVFGFWDIRYWLGSYNTLKEKQYHEKAQDLNAKDPLKWPSGFLRAQAPYDEYMALTSTFSKRVPVTLFHKEIWPLSLNFNAIF